MLPLFAERAHDRFQRHEVEDVAVRGKPARNLHPHAIVMPMLRLATALHRNEMGRAEAEIAPFDQNLPRHRRYAPRERRSAPAARSTYGAMRRDRIVCWLPMPQ